MKRILCSGVVALLLAQIPGPDIEAAVSARDWKVQGDGLLTYDDVNQREWLDLSVSSLAQFPAPKIENALAEISANGLFAGFTFAKRNDVLALAVSAGIDPTTDSFAKNASPVQSLIELLSPTPPFTGAILHSIGFVDEIPAPPFPPVYESADFRFDPGSGPEGRASVSIYAGNDLAGFAAGLMLYRVVPEPSGLVLVTLILLTAAFGCRLR